MVPTGLRKRFLTDAVAALEGADHPLLCDVLFAYRLLLGRMPEFGLERYEQRRGQGDIRDFVREVLLAPEFQKRWRDEVLLLPVCEGALMTQRPDGLRFWFDPGDWAIGWQIARGGYEPDVEQAIRALVEPGMVCLDVGANLGYFSVLMARCGAERVYAFEPFPSSFALLDRNLVENRIRDRVLPSRCAAYDTAGPATIRYAPGTTNPGGNFVPASEDSAFARAHAGLPIERVRLDDAIPESDLVAVVKMDIEGAELHAVRGMRGILERDRPVLIVEFNTRALRAAGEVEPGELLEELERNGYDVYRADEPDARFKWRPRGGEFIVNLVCRNRRPRVGVKS